VEFNGLEGGEIGLESDNLFLVKEVALRVSSRVAGINAQGHPSELKRSLRGSRKQLFVNNES